MKDENMYKEALERFLKLYNLTIRNDHPMIFSIVDEDGFTVKDNNGKSMIWIITSLVTNNLDIYKYILTKLYDKTISYRGNSYYKIGQKFVTVPSSYYELMIFLDLKGA